RIAACECTERTQEVDPVDRSWRARQHRGYCLPDLRRPVCRLAGMLTDTQTDQVRFVEHAQRRTAGALHRRLVLLSAFQPAAFVPEDKGEFVVPAWFVGQNLDGFNEQ